MVGFLICFTDLAHCCKLIYDNVDLLHVRPIECTTPFTWPTTTTTTTTTTRPRIRSCQCGCGCNNSITTTTTTSTTTTPTTTTSTTTTATTTNKYGRKFEGRIIKPVYLLMLLIQSRFLVIWLFNLISCSILFAGAFVHLEYDDNCKGCNPCLTCSDQIIEAARCNPCKPRWDPCPPCPPICYPDYCEPNQPTKLKCPTWISHRYECEPEPCCPSPTLSEYRQRALCERKKICVKCRSRHLLKGCCVKGKVQTCTCGDCCPTTNWCEPTVNCDKPRYKYCRPRCCESKRICAKGKNGYTEYCARPASSCGLTRSCSTMYF